MSDCIHVPDPPCARCRLEAEERRVWQVIDDPKDIVGLMDAHAAAAYERGRLESEAKIRRLEKKVEQYAEMLEDGWAGIIDVLNGEVKQRVQELANKTRARAAEEGRDE